jgi:hypothetical protein
MNDEYWTDLGRRAVACERWRWMAGMLAKSSNGYTIRAIYCNGGVPVIYVSDDDVLVDCSGDFDSENALPDFRDPATVGALWGLLEWMGYRVSMGYRIHSTNPMACLQKEGQETIYFSGESVAEALVSALESAK